MRNRYAKWLSLVTAALLVVGCTAGAGSKPVTGGGSVMDQNNNKIFDNLESVLARSTEAERIPVLIMARAEQDLAEVEKAVVPLEVKHRYRVVPAMAATVTPEQVKELARLDQVQHIEHDAEVRIAMDGANRWFGASQARSDYSVDGNRDGSAGFSKNDVVVAVIDTGIDPAHVDLDGGKVIAWQDWVANRPAAYDDHGHGTHVASIVAGTGDGNSNYAGVAPGAALIGLKVLNSAGSGSLSNVAAAVDWAVANRDVYNIRVISMKLIQVTQRRPPGPVQDRTGAFAMPLSPPEP